jgi:hypothetical protein
MSSFCLVADYSQNLGLPHFGEEQPGDTYYFSPLSVFVFGVVDVSYTPEKLFAYGYTEDQGLKGGNNVASLVMHALKSFGWLAEGKCGKRLSIVMDNCSGQNKNNHVLRLALLLVERKHFQKVEFIFYVRGHTKNVCDRMFNLLKKRYHKSQIFSVDKLTDVLNEIDNVNYDHVTFEVFYNYQLLLGMFYKNIPSGAIKINHFFWVDQSQPTTMHRITYHNNPLSDTESFDHGIEMDNRESQLIAAINNNVRLIPPGMKAIKQVELWKKWGPLIPEDERDALCAKPPDAIIARVAKERSDKAKRKRTNDDDG